VATLNLSLTWIAKAAISIAALVSLEQIFATIAAILGRALTSITINRLGVIELPIRLAISANRV